AVFPSQAWRLGHGPAILPGVIPPRLPGPVTDAAAAETELNRPGSREIVLRADRRAAAEGNVVRHVEAEHQPVVVAVLDAESDRHAKHFFVGGHARRVDVLPIDR